MKFVFKMAFKHLLSSKIQSALIIMAVALGVLVIIFIPAINLGFYKELLDKTINTSPHITISKSSDEREPKTLKVVDDQWYINKDNTTLENKRIQSYKNIIKDISSLESVIGAAPLVSNNATLINGEQTLNVEFIGITYPDYQQVVDIDKDLLVGTYTELNPDGIVPSQRIADKLKATVGDTITLSSRNATIPLKITGLYSSGFYSKDLSIVYVSLNTAQRLSGLTSQVDSVGVKVKDPWKAEKIAMDITYLTGFFTQSWKVDNESLLSEIAQFDYIMIIINSVIMLAVSAGVLGIMIILINAKSKQIGMLKALGVTSPKVIQIFVLEGILLSLLGAIVGSLLATGSIMYINANPMTISENYGVSEMKAIYSLPVYGQGFLLAICSSTIAAFIPAYFASKIDPAEVLKSQ